MVATHPHRSSSQSRSVWFYGAIGAVTGLIVLVPCALLLSTGGGKPTAAVMPAPINDKPAPAPAAPVVAPVVTPQVKPWPAPAAPKPAPVVSPAPTTQSEAAIDLIARVTAEQNTFLGTIARQGSLLVTHGNKPDLARVDLDLPNEYTLDLVVTPRTRAESLHVGLVVGGKPTVFLVDAFLGTRTGLFTIDGKGMIHPDYPGYKGTLLKLNEPTRLRISVTPRTITAWCDDKAVFAWQGNPDELQWTLPYPKPEKSSLLLGSWDCRFEISQWQLTPGAK